MLDGELPTQFLSSLGLLQLLLLRGHLFVDFYLLFSDCVLLLNQVVVVGVHFVIGC